MSVGTYSLAREGDKLLSPHFRVREFACRDGADLVKIDTDLVELLERIRTAACGAVTVNSGYRTASYNQKVGGARASQHLLGRAADIQVSGASPLLVGADSGILSGRTRWDRRLSDLHPCGHPDRTSQMGPAERTGGGRLRLARLAGPKEETVMDNISSAYAEEAVAWAVENGLLQGGEAGNLMLSQPVTRQQLAAVLYRFAKLEGQT